MHELLDRARCVELTHHVPGRGGVDDDQVPLRAPLERLPELPADLADRQDLLHPGRRVGNEVECTGERAQAAEDRDPRLHLEVLAQRRLGVHLHREHARMYLARLEADRCVLEQRGQVALGVDFDEQHPLAALGGEQRSRRSDRALADPALPGEEQEPPVEQAGRGAHRRGASARTRRAWRHRPRRSRRRRSCRRACRPSAPWRR